MATGIYSQTLTIHFLTLPSLQEHEEASQPQRELQHSELPPQVRPQHPVLVEVRGDLLHVVLLPPGVRSHLHRR